MIIYLLVAQLIVAKSQSVPMIITVVALIGIDYVYLKLISILTAKNNKYHIVALSLIHQ